MKIYKASMMHHVTMLLVISSALAGVLMQSEDLPNGTPAPPRPKPAPKPLDPKRDHIDPADVFESKLYAQDGVPYQRFGSSLVQNDRLVAVSTDTSSGSPSRVYLFQQLNTTSFVEYAKLHSSSSDDGYGICMAMSERFLLVGAPYDDSTGYLSGRVYVYSLANAYSSSVSTEASTILESSSGYKLGGLYGSSVSILGDSIAVGAPMDSTFQQFSGAVFLYSYNAVDSSWKEATKLYDNTTGRTFNRFGSRVQLLSESSIAIASTGYPLNTNSNVGAVFLFSAPTNSSLSLDWTVHAVLYPTYTHTDASFGYSMAFHEQSIAFIAAYSETRSGMIYVFHAQPAGSATSSEQWAVHQILMPTDMNNQMNAYGQSISIRALSITNASLQASGSEEIMNTSETRSASSLRSDATSTKHQYASNGATKNITYNYLVAVVGSPGDQAMGVESGAIYIYASLQSATVNNTEVFYSSEAMAWQLLGKVTGNDTETMSSYGHSVLCNAHGTILVSAILANTPISQQSGAVYVEHSLAPYLIAEEYQHDPDGEEASSGGSSSCSWGQFFRRWMTSTGSIVGLACLPAAFFVLFVLMQTHKDEIHDYFFRSKSTIDSAKYGQVNESSTSDLVRHPLEIDTSSANTDSHISPLEQVLRALLARQSSVLGDNSAREHAGIVSRVVHSFRSMWMRGERRDDPILPSDPSSATSSCHGEGFRDDPVQDDVEDKASNPLIIGTGSSSLPAMAMETEARKRDLLDRMHRIVNSGVNPMSAPSRRRRRSESLSPQVEEEHGDDDGEGKSEAIQV